jgi:hypothetical protein
MDRAKETLIPKKVFKGSRIVSGVMDGTAIGMLIFAAILPIVIILWWGKPILLRDLVTLVFLGLYVFAVISTFAIIVLWGLQRLDLPNKFMMWLGGATVGEIAGLLAFGYKELFK